MKTTVGSKLFTFFLSSLLFFSTYSWVFAGPYYYGEEQGGGGYDPGSPNGHGYVGAIAAITNNQRTDVAIQRIGGPAVRINLDQEPGWIAGLKAGWQFPDSGLFKFAFEGDVLYNAAKLNGDSTLGGKAVDITADLKAWVFMASALVRMDLGAFEPYAGLGIGAVHLSLDSPTLGISGKKFVSNDLGDWGWAYQLVAGGEFLLFSDRLGLFAEYKYLAYRAVEQVEDFRQHVFGAGVRVHF